MNNGLGMMCLGVVWFFTNEVLSEVYPTNYSGFSDGVIFIVSLIRIFIVIYPTIWFILEGHKIVKEKSNLR